MTAMQRTWEAWAEAHGALDAVCAELAAVPGAGDEYAAMCRAVNRMQAEGQVLIEAANRAYEKAR